MIYSNLDAMSDHDRAAVLDVHLRELEDSIAGLDSGEATPMKGTVEEALDEAREARKELIKVAQGYGLWLDEVAA